ncbi:hypothetical protein PI124_g24577 [Phytophthora idaei]|nr:hypothetical protein PI124_g24577 [Phytophthora idaei]
MLMGAPVSWGSKKQSSVSLSTSEAEYIALSLAIQEGKWIRRLLCEILAATNETGPELKIREDNQSCIKMTKNPVNHGRAKHIDIKYHHIRDEVKRGEVKLEYCETSVMLADIMTKALPGPRHKDLTAVSASSRSVRHATGLEEASAPDDSFERRAKRRSSVRMEPDLADEEEKDAHDDEDGDSTPPTR